MFSSLLRNKNTGFLALCGVALLTSFAWVGFPRQVIFDEVHFGKFVTAYCCTGERFFDIHPPHAKLLVAGSAYILGYRGGFDFATIGKPYGDVSPIPLRFLPALAGALLPLVAYGILRALGVSKEFSLLGGLAIALDNALKVQSRLIGLDSVLLLATFGSVWLLLLWRNMQATNLHITLLLGSGALAGLAAGTKITGLAALATVGLPLVWLIAKAYWQRFDGWKQYIQRHSIAGILILLAAIFVYAAGWMLHFIVLDKPGPGDAWGKRTGNIVQDIVQEHRSMISANYNLTATHPYSSKWWTWPTMARPVFYWAGSSGGWIYFQGNPVVWWGGSILFIVAAVMYLLDKRMRKKHALASILLLGFIISYVPFVRIPRALFLYHYLTPLLFSLLFGIWWLDGYLANHPKKHIIVQGIVLLIAIGFIVFSPVTYGFDAWQEMLVWFPHWR